VNPNLLVIDSGNWSDTNETTGPLKSDFIFKTMQRLGTDVVALGERELKNVDRVFELAGEAPVVVSNNLTRNGEPVGAPPLVRDIGGVRVGVFSLIQDTVVERAGDVAKAEFEAEDIFEASDRIVAELNDQGAEIIVMMSQLELAFADSVIRRHNDDIDVALLGYKGSMRKTHTEVGPAITIRAGSRGQHAGYVDLQVDPDGNIVDYGGSTIVLGGRIDKDPATLVMVNEVKAEVERLRKEAQALRQTEFQNQQQADRFLGAETCARCHQEEFEKWQSGPHAHAWTTLVDLGMESNDECVSCHVTGHDQLTGFENAQMKPNLASVQCEACHNMGTLHEPIGEADQVAANCMSCHDGDNSPEFDLTSYLEKIRHW
jgi:hypothetical protein